MNGGPESVNGGTAAPGPDTMPQVPDEAGDRRACSFRGWVRETCRRAILWGIGAIALLGGISWYLRDPDSEPLSRAFGALLLYGVLFLASLAKIWWTAGGDAVVLEEDALAYQPLHTFRPRRIPLGGEIALTVHRSGAVRSACEGVQAHVRSSSSPKGCARILAREFFLNLGLIDGRTEFLTRLGDSLEARGLEPVAGRRWSWLKPGWSEE